ncbi:MAG TPA: PAS domain-containing protein [Spirochaetota bacterium]|nr:PAS domain-containing protein [Spirochaetota bacterium]HPI89222.1 PAS domain-containing protein [Spirochaetota bacterium]HPR48961.1 PAS domain-containing protein [Spirochaetota bacterium]
MKKEDLTKLTKEELLSFIDNLSVMGDINLDDVSPLPIDYKALLEATSDIIFVIDKEEKLIYVNQAWRSFYPSKKAVQEGEHYSKFIPEIERDRAVHVFRSVINDGTVIENEIMKTLDEDGNTVYFLITFSPLRSSGGVIHGLVGIMKNITERHLMERRLKENTRILEEKVKEHLVQSDEIKGLRDLNEEFIKNAPIGIFMMDRSGIMLSENPALARIMGRSHGETAVGVNLLSHNGFIEAGFSDLFERCLRDKKTITVKNAPYVPLIGDRELIINVTMTPVLDKSGSVEKAIVMVEDNTEQARITKRVNRAEKLSALGFLASGVASKLTDPINRMYMDLNFVKNNIREDNPGYEYVEYLVKELNIIKNMSEQLVALSGTDDVNREICEINKALTTHPLDVQLNRLKSKGFDISLDLPDESPRVRASSKQIKQVVHDLIENAEEAMPESEGHIEIAVKTLTGKDGLYVAITITDSGIGIPDDNLKRIFLPFFSTKGSEATGLGLMIASSIVENLGGSIGIKSRPGEGTSVRIVLPMVVDEPEQKAQH